MQVLARYTVGTGGFIAEASLRLPLDDDAAWWTPHLRPGVGLAELVDVYCHPLRRGHGWAQTAVQACCAHADTYTLDVLLYALPFGITRTQAGQRVYKLPLPKLLAWYGQLGFSAVDDRTMLRRCHGRKARPGK